MLFNFWFYIFGSGFRFGSFFFFSIAFSSLFRLISFLARNVGATLETVHDCDCDDPVGIGIVSSDNRLICGALCLVKSLMAEPHHRSTLTTTISKSLFRGPGMNGG